MHRKDAVVSAERLKIASNLAAHKIELIAGTARFEDSHTVLAMDQHGALRSLHGEVILIATGSKPHRPPEIPFDDKTIFDSDSILAMDRIPKSMIVVGGGVIGCEYASIFTAMGVEVTLVDGRERLLPFLDAEISERLRARLVSLGLSILFSGKAEEHRTHGCRSPDDARIQQSCGSRNRAVCRRAARRRRWPRPGTSGTGDRSTRQHRRERPIPDHVSHIYAAGDVIGFPALASTSMEQGRVAMCHAFGFPYKQRLARSFPWESIRFRRFQPWARTRNPARTRKFNYESGRAKYSNNARGQIIGELRGY